MIILQIKWLPLITTSKQEIILIRQTTPTASHTVLHPDLSGTCFHSHRISQIGSRISLGSPGKSSNCIQGSALPLLSIPVSYPVEGKPQALTASGTSGHDR